jgi:hypothetical protein
MPDDQPGIVFNVYQNMDMALPRQLFPLTIQLFQPPVQRGMALAPLHSPLRIIEETGCVHLFFQLCQLLFYGRNQSLNLAHPFLARSILALEHLWGQT